MPGKQLKRRKIYFGSQFQRFKSMVSWLHYFRPEVRLNIMVVEVSKGKLCSPHDRQDVERKGPGTRYNLHSHAFRLSTEFSNYSRVLPTENIFPINNIYVRPPVS
jgi:hypothetical protein